MVVGSVLGGAIGPRIQAIAPIGDAFIRLLLLVAIPLVFVNLLAGLTSLTDLRTFGRLAAKILTFFLSMSVIALLLGLVAAYVLRPGAGMQLRQPVDQAVASVPSLAQVLLDLIPANVFQAFAQGNIAQIVVFAVLLGIATLLLPEAPRDRLRSAFADLALLFRKLIDLILWVAPIGIGALMAVTVGRYGAQLIGPMTRFLLGVWGAQLVMLVLYMALLVLLTKWRPGRFLRATATLWATTIATTSSLASLSVALDEAERMGLPRAIYAFTLPLGTQINKHGTAIMLMAVLLFTAQAAGMAFTASELVTVVLMGLLLAASSGGIPGGGFVVALILVQAFSLPTEVAAIVGGIYRLVDMGNTTINVMGTMVGTVIVADLEAK